MLIWRGLSRFTNKPISAVITGYDPPSDNSKTGKMAQLWILPSNKLNLSKNDDVCGNCPLSGNGCYVNLGMGPAALHNKRVKNKRKIVDTMVLREKLAALNVRFGSFGEPTLLPLTLIRQVIKASKGFWTGYTHTWKEKWAQPYKKYFMASVETLEQKQQANKLGWRTYRIVQNLSEIQTDEMICPAQPAYLEKTGKKIQCNTCLACSGNSFKGRNVIIQVHGGRGKLAQATKYLNIVNQV